MKKKYPRKLKATKVGKNKNKNRIKENKNVEVKYVLRGMEGLNYACTATPAPSIWLIIPVVTIPRPLSYSNRGGGT